MIELNYKIDLTKDQRSFEAINIKDLTKSEASNFVHFIEKIKLDILVRDFELGDDGLEVSENV